jgi:hypothetical protein
LRGLRNARCIGDRTAVSVEQFLGDDLCIVDSEGSDGRPLIVDEGCAEATHRNFIANTDDRKITGPAASDGLTHREGGGQGFEEA